MKTANPRAEPLPEHGEGREVQLGVAMGVSVMLLRIDLGLVVEEPIQNVGCVPFRALDRGAVEGRVVVGDEGVELQRVVAQAMAVRGLQGLPGKEVALAVAARGPRVPPDLGGVAPRDPIDEVSQGTAELVLAELPVGESADGLVRDVVGHPGHGLGANVAAVGHHAGKDLADVLDRALPAPAWRNEVTRPVELIVDLDKEIGKANRSHVRTHP